jgi:hypothetical protein
VKELPAHIAEKVAAQRDPGEVDLACLAGFKVDGVGQIGEEPANDPYMVGADLSRRLRGRHVGQHRPQRFA